MFAMTEAELIRACGNELGCLPPLIADAEKAVAIKLLRVGVDGRVPGLVCSIRLVLFFRTVPS